MNNLKAEIERIKAACKQAIKESTTLDALEKARVTFLGRKGSIAVLMPQLKNLSVEEKRTFGPRVNELKQTAEKLFLEKKETLFDVTLEEQEKTFKDFDVTAYKPGQSKGSLHLYTQATQLVQDIFISMGYTVADGPEVETEYHNFEALNIPKDHPARDIQDTFFLNFPQMVMRTHTSNVQIRGMKNKKPPLALIAMGRAYRHEATDASHDFMFRQMEGLVVAQDISLSNMIATMKAFLQQFFEKKSIEVRARPGYFPFVEPGVEIDMSCPFCKKGCSTCKQTKWIEVVGSGLVHPNVLKMSGIDPEKYSGFAFGFGLTRLVMLKYGISDIRLLHSAQKEFLKQF